MKLAAPLAYFQTFNNFYAYGTGIPYRFIDTLRGQTSLRLLPSWQQSGCSLSCVPWYSRQLSPKTYTTAIYPRPTRTIQSEVLICALRPSSDLVRAPSGPFDPITEIPSSAQSTTAMLHLRTEPRYGASCKTEFDFGRMRWAVLQARRRAILLPLRSSTMRVASRFRATSRAHGIH